MGSSRYNQELPRDLDLGRRKRYEFKRAARTNTWGECPAAVLRRILEVTPESI